MRISDWSSDVCSSDLTPDHGVVANAQNTGVTGSLDLIIGADGLGTVSLLGNEGLSDVTSGGQPVTYVVDPSDPSLLIAHTGGDETDESARACTLKINDADRKSAVEGKGVAVSVGLGGRRT